MTYRITVVAIALLFAGCNATHDPLPNKSTNWLRECTSNRMCSDGLSCLCGVCTKTCGRAADCGTEPATTRCTGVSRSALSNQCTPESAGDAEAICVAACKQDSDCASSSSGFECRERLCVVRADAGMPYVPAHMHDGNGVDAGGPDGPDISNTPLPDAGSSFGLCDPAGGCEDAGSNEITCTDVGDASVCVQPCQVECGAGQMCFGDVCADLLASDQTWPTSQALDSSRLYWTTTGTEDELHNYRKDGAIQAVSLQNGEVTTLASNRVGPTRLAINATHAYWVEGSGHYAFASNYSANDDSVWRVALDGGDPERVANALPLIDSLVVDESYVYLLIQEGSDAGGVNSAVHRMPNDGSAKPERLFGLEGTGGRLFVDDKGLCWTSANGGGTGQVGTASKDGADPHVLSMTGSGMAQMAVDATTIYWMGQYTPTIASVPRAGGDAHVLASKSGWDGAVAMAVDSKYVYSGHQESSVIWSVSRTDKQFGMTEVLLRGPNLQQMMLAVGDSGIYIVSRGDPRVSNGTVLRLKKP